MCADEINLGGHLESWTWKALENRAVNKEADVNRLKCNQDEYKEVLSVKKQNVRKLTKK